MCYVRSILVTFWSENKLYLRNNCVKLGMVLFNHINPILVLVQYSTRYSMNAQMAVLLFWKYAVVHCDIDS